MSEPLVWQEPNPASDSRLEFNLNSVNSERLMQAGRCPCDQCRHRARCRDEALACDVFADWFYPGRTQTKKPRPFQSQRVPGQRLFRTLNQD